MARERPTCCESDVEFDDDSVCTEMRVGGSAVARCRTAQLIIRCIMRRMLSMLSTLRWSSSLPFPAFRNAFYHLLILHLPLIRCVHLQLG